MMRCATAASPRTWPRRPCGSARRPRAPFAAALSASPAQRLGARLNGRYRRKKTYLGIYRLEEKLHKEFEQLVGLGFLKRKE